MGRLEIYFANGVSGITQTLLVPKFKKALLLIGTAVGTAAVSYTFVGLPISILALVVLCHEIGHVLATLYYGGRWEYSVIIPLVIAAVGITKISGLAKKFRSKVLIAGPIFGIVSALIVLCIGIILSLKALIDISIIAVIVELFNVTFGSDGRKLRKCFS